MAALDDNDLLRIQRQGEGSLLLAVRIGSDIDEVNVANALAGQERLQPMLTYAMILMLTYAMILVLSKLTPGRAADLMADMMELSDKFRKDGNSKS